MSLNTDWRNVIDEDAIKFLKRDRADFNTGVYCMVVGIPRITEKNYVEWYRRYLQYSIATGVSKAEANRYYPIDLVKALIGYSCNASEKTPAAFRKFIMEKFDKYTNDLARIEKWAGEPEKVNA